MKIEISGIDELRKSINVNRIQKSIALGVGQAALAIHSELRASVVNRYKISSSEINSVLIGKSVSPVTFGKNIIHSDLEYRQKAVPLAHYFKFSEMGNIPPSPKKRKGRVHRIEIRRGKARRVFGKRGLGGFIPTYKDGKRKLSNGRLAMFERLGRSRYPIEELFGPSIAELIQKTYRINEKAISERSAKLIEETLGKSL